MPAPAEDNQEKTLHSNREQKKDKGKGKEGR